MNRYLGQAKKTTYEYQDIHSIQFSAISSDQIKNYSVLEIDEEYYYENDRPVIGGLFDLRLGVSEPGQKCQTCRESAQCIGHFGHIKLEEPVLHYGFLDTVANILKCICHRCFRLKRPTDKDCRLRMKEIKRYNDPEKKLSAMVKLLHNIKKCKQNEQEDPLDKSYKGCGAEIPSKIVVKNYRIYSIDLRTRKQVLIDRRQIKRLLEGFSVYNLQCQAIGFTKTKPIDLMIQNLLVVPPQVRPYVLMNHEKKCEDDLSTSYRRIIKLNKRIRHLNIGSDEKPALLEEIERIIGSIMVTLNSATRKEAIKGKKQNLNIKSISDRLKGKEGRFRQNLLGKRVDFSARTVISPDPNLQLNQVGVPERIAKNLTYPQKITSMNIDHIIDLILQKKVKYLINPPQINLRNEQKIINLNKLQISTREQILAYLNYGMIAERVLQNGDYVLLNRQPTLHRMSMMAHKVKILPYDTFRINLSVCAPYNADFDGDQMNIHVPQSLEALSELKNIALVPNQIVGPKNGTTSMGFSQDSLLGAYLITSKDTFLDREEVMNLLVKIGGDEEFVEKCLGDLPFPAILKPEPLWTGKQLVSIIIPKQVEFKRKGAKNLESQKTLYIRRGEIISGTLQREHIGPSTNAQNIIHHIWIQSGPKSAEQFINSLQKIIYTWMTNVGFSLGACDIVPDQKIVEKKVFQTKNLSEIYYEVFNQFRDKKLINKKHLHQQGKNVFDSFQFLVNEKLNNNLSKIQQIIKNTYNSKSNNIYKIIEAKSKGSETNLAQILYSVGNQNINGKRVPIGFTKRSLPHFHKDDNSPIARGYVFSSFYQGLKPQQFFFHSMGGRQGLSDTAVKTSSVGYIQRKIIKSLQDIIVKYDSSVRDSNNNIIQVCYGEDGFSGEFIERHRCFGAEASKKLFRESYKWREDELRKFFRYSPKEINAIKNEYSLLFFNRKMLRKFFSQNGAFDYHCPISIERIINKIKLNFKPDGNKSDKVDPFEVYQAVEKLIEGCCLPAEKNAKYYSQTPNQPNQKKEQKGKDQYDSFSDEFQREDLDSTIIHEKNYKECLKVVQKEQFNLFKMHLRFNLSSKVLVKVHGLSRMAFNELIKEIRQKYFKFLVPAGQSVGCLAAQSIGEPTTQMTLNTFHLAGISDRNVTLGIPRLEQILNCSTNEKTILTIFPKKPILQSESHNTKNQEYLLNLLINCFPEVKIVHFIDSVRYSFNPKLKDPQQQVETVAENKISSATLSLTFNYNKIYSNSIWEEIIDQIKRKTHKIFQVGVIVDYNDITENALNPEIALKLMKNVEQKSKNGKANNLISFFQQTENILKGLSISGINGLKDVKISKTALNLSQETGLKDYVVFKGAGQCLKECLMHSEVNSNKTFSNNSREIAAVLGIEAARESLIREFKQVLKPYGISINYKHLSVLVDWMCSRGVLTPVNRQGLEKIKNLSVFTKASNQKANKTLFKAAVFSTRNDIKGTSQKIIFGQPTQCGTQQCQLMIDVEKCGKYVSKPDQTKIKLAEELNEFCDKTPQISPTYDNSYLDKSRGSIYGNRSPLNVSPYMGFSPSYSPTLSNLPISPVHANRSKIQGGDRTSYSRNPYQMPQISPTYAPFLNRINSPAQIRTPMENIRESYKIQENEETKRTGFVEPENKDEDEDF